MTCLLVFSRCVAGQAAAALIAVWAAPASAQGAGGQSPARAPAQIPGTAGGTGTSTNPSFELSGGYQFLRAFDRNFPFGLNVDGAWAVAPRVGLAGEFGWAFDQDEDEAGLANLDTHVWNVGVGPRWTGHSERRVWPFAQVLAGVQHARSSAEAAGVEFDDNDTWFMLQPGVGITYITGDGWGIVGQVDYRRVFAGEDDDDGDGGAGGEVDLVEENQFRVFIGVRMILD